MDDQQYFNLIGGSLLKSKCPVCQTSLGQISLLSHVKGCIKRLSLVIDSVESDSTPLEKLDQQLKNNNNNNIIISNNSNIKDDNTTKIFSSNNNKVGTFKKNEDLRSMSISEVQDLAKSMNIQIDGKKKHELVKLISNIREQQNQQFLQQPQQQQSSYSQDNKNNNNRYKNNNIVKREYDPNQYVLSNLLIMKILDFATSYYIRIERRSVYGKPKSEIRKLLEYSLLSKSIHKLLATNLIPQLKFVNFTAEDRQYFSNKQKLDIFPVRHLLNYEMEYQDDTSRFDPPQNCTTLEHFSIGRYTYVGKIEFNYRKNNNQYLNRICNVLKDQPNLLKFTVPSLEVLLLPEIIDTLSKYNQNLVKLTIGMPNTRFPEVTEDQISMLHRFMAKQTSIKKIKSYSYSPVAIIFHNIKETIRPDLKIVYQFSENTDQALKSFAFDNKQRTLNFCHKFNTIYYFPYLEFLKKLDVNQVRYIKTGQPEDIERFKVYPKLATLEIYFTVPTTNFKNILQQIAKQLPSVKYLILARTSGQGPLKFLEQWAKGPSDTFKFSLLYASPENYGLYIFQRLENQFKK